MKLTWKIDKTIPTVCPDYKPNPYTGEYPSFHCSVYHCETITEQKSAKFYSLKKIKKFIDKAPLSCYNFRVDGKPLKDTRKKPEITSITSLTDGETTAFADTFNLTLTTAGSALSVKI